MSAHLPARSAMTRSTASPTVDCCAYVDGHWTASEAAESFEVTDPASGATVAFVAALGAEQTTEATMPLRGPFPPGGLCCRRSARGPRKWFELIIAAKDDLALLMTLEQGKPLKESLGEIDYAASFVEWYAEEAKRLNAESVTSHLPGAEMMVRREPLGVVGVVTPWNFPSAMLTRKAAAALATGCTIVAHPSSETPLSALALAELGERAGRQRALRGDQPADFGRAGEARGANARVLAHPPDDGGSLSGDDVEDAGRQVSQAANSLDWSSILLLLEKET
ncbi:MAG: aldehyde dehydrogenase family protein [Mesorhizobium sp.]|nr:MAG: aldehyde dehydrogenase family protein [Mesorhizobium sp.]